MHEQANRSGLRDSKWIQELAYDDNVHTAQTGVSSYLSNSKVVVANLSNHKAREIEADQAILHGLQEELLDVGWLNEFEAGGPTVEEKAPEEEWKEEYRNQFNNGDITV